MFLVEQVAENARRSSQKAAILAGRGTATYGELWAMVSRLSRVFHDAGLRPGDVVGLAMAQTPLHLVAFFALARIGAVTLPLYPSVTPAEHADLLRRFAARAVVSDLHPPPRLEVTVIAITPAASLQGPAEFTGTFTPSGDDPLRIGLTSGTTESQRGFLETHGSFMQRLGRRFYGDTSDARVIPPNLNITPALQLACHALCAGGTVVFPVSGDVPNFLEAIARHAVTHVTLPPSNLLAMLPLLTGPEPAFPAIRHLRLLGATPSPELIAQARRKFSPNVCNTYSAAETGVIAFASPEDIDARPGSAGRVTEGARVETVDAEGRVLPQGEAGEIRVIVVGMARDYHGPDAGNRRFRDGWFHPGDHGRVDTDGFVYLDGRLDDVINVGGRKCQPAFVEEILRMHANVWDAAVFPFPDPVAGMRVAAAIESRGTLDWMSLDRHARLSLDVIAPSRYFRVDKLPRNAMGKVQRRDLAAWVTANGEEVKAG